MRIPFLIAFAQGKGAFIVNSISQMEYLPPDHKWSFPRISFNNEQFMLRKIANVPLAGSPSQGKNNNWTIALLTPLSANWTVGPRAYRKFRRAILTKPPGWLKGPWSLKYAEANYPTFSDRYLKPGQYDINGNHLGPVPGSVVQPPFIFMGDPDPGLISELDYQPSDADCNNDIEPSYEEIFGEIE